MKGKKFVISLVLAAVMGLSLCTLGLAEEKPVLDKYLDKYWGEKRDVRVIQKRLFLKDGRHEFSLFSGVIPNDEFYTFVPIGGRYTYFVAEDFGLELFGSYNISIKSKVSEELWDSYSVEVFRRQEVDWTAGACFNWSPIHGKLGIFNKKLFHFDWQFALGLGALGSTVRTNDSGMVDVEGGESKTKSRIDGAANLGTGLKLFFTDWFAVRLDYRSFLFKKFQGGVYHLAELSLGVAFYTK